ncbi:MAG: hypothetical protein GY856_54340 [bacterium]|nr:hypothetical protein [bacterium]
MAERSRIIPLLLAAAVGGLLISGCQPKPHPKPPTSGDDPAVVLMSSRGERAAGFAAFDTAFASFAGLRPNARHAIELVRSDGRVISRTALTADRRGVIPTTAVWWDVGVVYPPGSRAGRLDEEALYGNDYSLRILRDERLRDKRPIRQWPFPILEPRPVIHTSDAQGNPMNGFLHRRDDVYVTGRHLKPGGSYVVHIVPDRHDWRVGDRIDSLLPEPPVINLEPRQREFTRFILPWRPATVGAYDVVLEAWPYDEVLDRDDLVDSVYGVGFTVVIPLDSSLPHIATELACQAPPHDLATGAVHGAPNPIYKDVFAPVEEVWVAVNPWAGGESHAGMAARLYVVDHQTEADWSDGEPLADVSDDGYEEVTIQPGCANVNYTRVWTSPAIREDGYDVVVDFEPFDVYDRGQDFIDHLDAKGFVVPALWVALDSLTFNHDDASSASDGINLRKSNSEAVVVPEWQRNLEAHPAAYVTNRTVTVEAHFSAAPGVTSAKLRAAVDYGALEALAPTTVSFPASGPVTFQVSGPTPEAIRRFYQKWLWYVEDVNGSGSAEVLIGGTRNRIYTVLAPPQDPWTTTGQTRPWTEALDRACVWAAGETTATGAAGEVARHLYADTGGLYVYGSSYTSAWSGIFHLTNFLTAIPHIGEVNCYDMGKSVTIFANLLGAGLDYRYSSPFGSLHCEKAIGRNWYCGEAFSNHGFGSMDGRVVDACLTVDGDADPDAFPHAETWMLDVPWSDYKSAVVEDPGVPGDPVIYSFDID